MCACFCFCSCSGSAAGGRQRQHTGQNGKAAKDAEGKLGLVGLDLLPDGHSACCNVYCGTQVAIQEQIEADEVKITLGVLGGFAVLAGVLALETSGG